MEKTQRFVNRFDIEVSDQNQIEQLRGDLAVIVKFYGASSKFCMEKQRIRDIFFRIT